VNAGAGERTQRSGARVRAAPGLAAARARPIADTVEAAQRSSSNAFPRRLSRDQIERLRRDRELFRRYRDSASPVDRDVIIRRFLPLARQLAAGYAGGREPFDDLFQVACLGLVRAVDRFDIERRTAFSSYAVPTIVGDLKRHFRDKTWALRVPRDLQELGLAVHRATEVLASRLGRAPTIDELADAVGADPEAVLEARDALCATETASLETARPGDDGEAPLIEMLGCQEGGYHRVEARAVLDDMLRCLPPRQRFAVRLRFEDDLTQRQIGERMGVSQMQVSRLLCEALTRLRDVLSDEVAPSVRRAA
jgi:RNA polymerase sigma-B factor